MAYTPAKLIPFIMTNLGSNATYDYDDGSGDPWIGYPYRWNVSLAVTPQPHSDPNSSPTPFFWDGNNFNIGDWIFTSSDGFILKIVSITSQDSATVECVVEDVDRQNIFQDPSQGGSSIGPDGGGYLFAVKDGIPILYPVPDTLAGSLSPQFYANIMSRFMYDKSNTDVSVDQVAHGFSVGDIVRLTSSGQYALAQADTVENATVAGFVSLTGVPGPDRFFFTPIGPIVTHAMPLANPGDIIYLSDTVAGGLTVTPPALNPVKMFIYVDTNTGIYIGGKSITGGSGNGFQGATGVQGANGVDGFQGVNGINGVQGTAGINGFQGAIGATGFQGVNGINGVQGATGTNGFQGALGATGPQGASNTLQSYYAEKVGGGFTGPVWVLSTASGVEYDKPSAGHLTINVPAGVELSSLKLNLALADLATLGGVPFALEVLVRYLDGSRNTDVDNTSYPAVTIIDKSAISIGETQPTPSTPFQYKTIKDSLSVQVFSIEDNAGVGEATYRIQQLNFDYCTLILNF